GVAQGLLDALNARRALLRIRVRKSARVFAATDAGNGEASPVARAQDFVLVEMAGRFDALEAGGLEQCKFFQQRKVFAGECGEHVGFVEVAFLNRAFLSRRARRTNNCKTQGSAAAFQKLTPIHWN